MRNINGRKNGCVISRSLAPLLSVIIVVLQLPIFLRPLFVTGLALLMIVLGVGVQVALARSQQSEGGMTSPLQGGLC